MTENERQMMLVRRWKHQQSPELCDQEDQQARESEPFACKIMKKELVIRTQHYVIYQALRKTQKKKSKEFTFEEIAIKKYQSPPRLQNRQQSAQYQFLSKKTNLQDTFDLRPFSFKQQNYLQLSHIQFTLQDKLKYGVREFREQKDPKVNLRAQLYHYFKEQMIDLLNECHKCKPPIFIGSLSPTSIGVFEKEESDGKRAYSYHLIDFAQANVTDASKSLHLYDLRYLAPQFSNLSQSSDLWSFGCILYELLSNGDKLINDLRFHKLLSKEKTVFIEQRLNELNCKIRHINSQIPQIKQRQKLKFPFEALVLLHRCLRIDPQQRKLLQSKQEKQQQLLSVQQFQFNKNKIVYDISMQIFRLNVLQDNIMCVFEELYFNNTKTVKKHHLYPLLKFASCAYLQAYNRAKDKAKSYARNEKWDKYSQVKRIQEEKKLVDIKDKAVGKLIKELEQQKSIALKNAILKEFPEIVEDRIANAKEVYQAYWRFIKDDLCKLQNSNFFKYLYNIHFYMQEVPEMEEFLNRLQNKIRLKLDRAEMQEKKDPELIYFQQANKVSDIMEQKIESILSTSSISQAEKKDAQQRMQQALLSAIEATK